MADKEVVAWLQAIYRQQEKIAFRVGVCALVLAGPFILAAFVLLIVLMGMSA